MILSDKIILAHSKTYIKIFGICFFLCLIMFLTINKVTAQVSVNEIDTSFDEVKLLEYAESFLDTLPQNCILYGNLALQKAENAKNYHIATTCCARIGQAYYYQDEFNSALNYFEKQLYYSKLLNDDFLLSTSYNNLGIIYGQLEEVSKSISSYKLALNYKLLINDSAGVSKVLNNLGTLYETRLNNYDMALEYYRQSLHIDFKLNNKDDIATSYLNIGDLLRKMNQLDSSMVYLNKSLALALELNDIILYQYIYESFYHLYSDLGNYEEALMYYIKLTELKSNQLDLQKVQAIREIELKYESDEHQFEHDEENFRNERYNSNLRTQIIFFSLILFIIILGVSFSITIARFINKKNNIYKEIYSQEYKIKNHTETIRLQNKQLEETNKELERLLLISQTATNAISLFDSNGKLIWVNNAFEELWNLSLAEFIYQVGDSIYEVSDNKDISKIILQAVNDNKTINYTTVKKNSFNNDVWIETKLTPVLDESGYLKYLIAVDTDVTALKLLDNKCNIQLKGVEQAYISTLRTKSAMLPDENLLNKYFFEHFFIDFPRDEISGDFYWGRIFNNKLFFAVGDCAGHGIQGALLSIQCINLLNETLFENKPTSAAVFLNYLNKRIFHSFTPSNLFDEFNDGVDIAMVIIDLETGRLNYAGAFLSLLLVKCSTASKIEDVLIADKRSLGVYIDDNKTFTDHYRTLLHGDMLYFFTDGFYDQIGGHERKKFMKRRFLNLLTDVAQNSSDHQAEMLIDVFRSWKGKNPQIDDVTVIGLRF